MSDLISREYVLYAINPITGEGWEAGHAAGLCYDIVKNAPSVDAVPVVHGKWIKHSDVWGLTFECSNCHVEGMMYGKFCYNCGAKMDGDETIE